MQQQAFREALPPASRRVASIDVFRGFVMFLMWAEVCRFYTVAETFPESGFWHFVAFHTDHVRWTWASLHDMIQPAFTFLSGISLPFSIAGRLQKGDSKQKIVLHAMRRSLILIFLGVFLRSVYSDQTNWTFEDTLSQIGLGYTFLTLLGFTTQRNQIIALIAILVGYWLAFALYPAPGPEFNYEAVGAPEDWPYHYSGFMSHWNYNAHLGWAFDTWFLNLFPRKETFLYNSGSYSTLSFIPTLGTMILGLLAGNILKDRSILPVVRAKKYFIIGMALLLAGILLHVAGINPVVKKIWTPAWTLFSGGLCFLMLLGFYVVVDGMPYRRRFFPLEVIGMNSIAAYVIADSGLRSFISKSLHTHLGQQYDHIFGTPYATVVNGMLVLLIMWWILYWMYKRRIFLKI